MKYLMILGIGVMVVLGASGCRVFTVPFSIACEGVGTACKVTGHAAGVAASAVTLKPKGVVRHTLGAAGDVADGATDITGTVVDGAIDIID